MEPILEALRSHAAVFAICAYGGAISALALEQAAKRLARITGRPDEVGV